MIGEDFMEMIIVHSKLQKWSLSYQLDVRVFMMPTHLKKKVALCE